MNAKEIGSSKLPVVKKRNEIEEILGNQGAGTGTQIVPGVAADGLIDCRAQELRETHEDNDCGISAPVPKTS
jgi:hypothetical protein